MNKRYFKKFFLFLIFVPILFSLLYTTGCNTINLSKNVKDIKSLSNYIDKYPLLGLYFIDQMKINKAFVTLKTNDYKSPLININGVVKFKNIIDIAGFTQIGSNKIDIFSLFYDFNKHSGFFYNIIEKEKYEISSASLKLSKNIMIYFENDLFLLMLFFKNYEFYNIKNGEFLIEDILFKVADYKIISSELESQTLKININYTNYKKWENIYYPSIITVKSLDYEFNLLLTDIEFTLSF